MDILRGKYSTPSVHQANIYNKTPNRIQNLELHCHLHVKVAVGGTTTCCFRKQLAKFWTFSRLLSTYVQFQEFSGPDYLKLPIEDCSGPVGTRNPLAGFKCTIMTSWEKCNWNSVKTTCRWDFNSRGLCSWFPINSGHHLNIIHIDTYIYRATNNDVHRQWWSQKVRATNHVTDGHRANNDGHKKDGHKPRQRQPRDRHWWPQQWRPQKKWWPQTMTMTATG